MNDNNHKEIIDLGQMNEYQYAKNILHIYIFTKYRNINN